MQAVIGLGVLGTALATQLRRAGEEVALLATDYDGDFLAAMQKGDPHPGMDMPFPDASVAEPGAWDPVFARAEMIVVAVATAGLIDVVEQASRAARNDALWVVGTKGWDFATLRSASAVVADCLGDERRVVALVGPSLAGEITAGVPTAVLCASVDKVSAGRVAGLFATPLFRTYVTDDIAGVEVGAALKNVISIGVGMCDGLAEEFGVRSLTNTKSFIFARGIIEMSKLAQASGGRLETVLGLAGTGDLFVSVLAGRNARFGSLLGQGKTPEEAFAEMHTTVEGYVNARAAVALADRYGLALPVIRTIARVLYEGLAPRSAIEDILASGTIQELDD